ncbi:glyceraldehyde-3-phosphate dehydrogenase (NADP+) [Natronospira proteinivora]|uniref:Glyceraldehyde-3-phosphate dehydrogenase (NADP+) n=1 Tax=Natronospira proteinivora TaxID=1807133 RepID=A0ABT1G6H5_9GAMM|nr:aldehyde dehydrogenase family protein [Natronospira proteinivora]MCP1726891.1 glyceraldehyde-3-phosphate dehydrogenase (NADP+) [Natronospira proteinivora]
MSTRTSKAPKANGRIDVLDPQDGSLVESIPRYDAKGMQSAIDQADAALPRARRMPVHERMRVLYDAADYVDRHRGEFAETLSREGVKTINEARAEVARTVMTLRLSAEETRRIVGNTIAFDQRPGSENRFGYSRRIPVGLIGAITPFNDPLNLVAHKVGPAIAGGNAVIVKPHEATPLSAIKLLEAFHAAGVEEGIFQVIPGYGADAGDALVVDERVRMISFTGGRETGEKIMQRAGLKKFGMELGSNSPTIVMNDADLEQAIPAIIGGAVAAAGQNCLHVQRLLLHESIYETARDQFVESMGRIRYGDKYSEDMDMGPMIDPQAAERVDNSVQKALRDGARLLTGGQRQGNFYAPTVLEAVPDNHPMVKEEIFGPVTSLHAFRDEDEAIAIANNVDYGLHAGVFTSDVDAAFRVADALECGGVMINDSSDYRLDAAPFGGVKGSGIGREGVGYVLNEMTEPKVYCFNIRFPKGWT